MKQKIYLVYDEECPLCDHYCRMVSIRKSVGELVLINAREDSLQMKQISDRGLDIDQGMVLIIDEAYYYASEAINVLALISSNNGLFNKFNQYGLCVFNNLKANRFKKNNSLFFGSSHEFSSAWNFFL